MADKKKSAIIAFLGNAYHDSRVVNLIESLERINIIVTTISFDWKIKDFRSIYGKTSVYKLDKSKSSLLFYFKFFYLLIRDLIKKKPDYYFAEDIYTLPIVYFFAKLNKSKIFYNSREIYAHLAGLRNKNVIQNLIARVESTFIRKVNLVLVTGDMDAEYLKQAYSIQNIFVLRNLPKYQEEIKKIDLHEKLGISKSEKIILYQGVVLEGRGIPKVINIIDKLKNAHMVIIGDGEFKEKYEELVKNLALEKRIHFIGAVNHTELLSYTAGADIGIVLIENISISYYYALPNKLFEYIMAGIPILASDLPQIKKVIDIYNVGRYVNPENEIELLDALNEMLDDDMKNEKYRLNCATAARELNWESEFEKFKDHFH